MEQFQAFFCRIADILIRTRDAMLANEEQMLVTALMLITLTGLLGGVIAKKLKQPLILGYILCGVFVGFAYKAGFGTAANVSLNSLANIGVALLLFSMGLEFSKKDILPVYKISVWGSLAQVAVTFCAGTGIAYGLSRFKPDLFNGITSYMLFATAFVSTSTAVLLKTLTSKGRMGTLSSRVMIGVSIVQDLTVIPIMLLVGQLHSFSGVSDGKVFWLLGGVVFIILLVTLGAKYIPMWLEHIARMESKELFLLAVTGLALGIGYLTERFELSFSFGAFITGIILSDSAYGKKALYEMMPVRDIFAMLFFVSIGMMLDISFLTQNFVLVCVLVLITGLSRTVFLSAVTWFSGYRNVIPIAMLLGMFPTSEIAFVVIQSGQNAGIFTPGLYSLILCVVVCSMIVSPAIDSLTSPVYSLLRRTLWKHTARQDIVIPPPDLNNHVIIAGGGAIARSIAMLLTRLQLPYIIIETEYPSFQEARKNQLICLYGDPQQEVILTGAGIAHARILLLAATGFEDNLAVIHAARNLNPDITIVARADSQDEVTMLHRENIFEIVQPKLEAGLELTRQALLSMQVPPVEIQNYLDAVRFDRYKPLMEGSDDFSTIAKMRSFAGLVALNWIKLPEISPFTGKMLSESGIRSQYGVLVVGILRNGKFLSNPAPSTMLETNDILAVIGTPVEQKNFGLAAGSPLGATPAAAEARSV